MGVRERKQGSNNETCFVVCALGSRCITDMSWAPGMCFYLFFNSILLIEIYMQTIYDNDISITTTTILPFSITTRGLYSPPHILCGVWGQSEQSTDCPRTIHYPWTKLGLLLAGKPCWNMGFRVQHCTLLFYLSYICGINFLFYLHFCGTPFSICSH